ncbi:aldehyde dehydrogenase family protein [Blastococcus sp. Marseille-P5729]|uniref:aldehyde dehydrogenase family protein n=1 Tax=Blastococcus sp. Marseille-P5729 TaxID=2086582 RepID=UPI000D0F4977|nr:aldehyde dehydrogenase family protein [Blastococcus sp. Marseille-P5729]
MADTFDSLDPATGEVVATFPIAGAADVRAVVAEAREASRWWAMIGFSERKKRLLAWRSLIAGRIDELADLVHREGGKTRDDAMLETILAIDHIDWAAKHAAKVLGRRSVSPGLLSANHAATIQYLPYGVVGVIGPWNYPVFTPMGSITYALAASNAVVFKPSEFTPAVGEWLVRTFAEVVPEQPVLQVVTGLGETGAALCEAGVDKIAFTGSSATGKKVMQACSATLTPVLVECGGKDVLIIDEDADIEAAAQAAAWGACSNAGQTCVGTERVYAHEKVYDKVLHRTAEIMRDLQPGNDGGAAYGPMTMPSQLDVVRRHVDAAIADGGRAVLGGPESIAPPYVRPVVLAEVPETSVAIQEETFGPVVIINKVASMDEAVTKANATPYGLAAAVFSRSAGERIAARLRTGMVAINSVISFAGIPSLPFGGVGESGFGRIHGEDGLREFARSQSVAKLRVPIPLVVTSFARKPYAVRLIADMMRRRFRGGAS